MSRYPAEGGEIEESCVAAAAYSRGIRTRRLQ
jgi:hypothetical protein